MPRPRRRTGVAAVVAGAGLFAGQGGELAFGSPNTLADALFVGCGVLGLVALGIALLDLKGLIEAPRSARVGVRLALVGTGALWLFGVQLAVAEVRTGDVPDNFLLFALGFVLVFVGQPLFARGLRGRVPGLAWLLPVAASVGLAFALTGGESVVHDLGLFLYEAAWIGLGVAILRSAREESPSGAAVTV